MPGDYLNYFYYDSDQLKIVPKCISIKKFHKDPGRFTFSQPPDFRNKFFETNFDKVSKDKKLFYDKYNLTMININCH